MIQLTNPKDVEKLKKLSGGRVPLGMRGATPLTSVSKTSKLEERLQEREVNQPIIDQLGQSILPVPIIPRGGVSEVSKPTPITAPTPISQSIVPKPIPGILQASIQPSVKPATSLVIKSGGEGEEQWNNLPLETRLALRRLLGSSSGALVSRR